MKIKKIVFGIMGLCMMGCAVTMGSNTSYAKNKTEIIKNNVLKEYRGNAETYNVPNNVKAISSRAFEKAKRLKKVVISKNVKKISYDAFSGAKNLTKITVNKKNRHFDSYKGVLYNEGFKEMIIVPEGIKTLVPASNSTISDGCHECLNLPKLTSLTIGAKWKTLGEETVWWNPGGLTQIKVQKNNKVFYVKDGNLFRKNNEGKVEYVLYIAKGSDEVAEYTIPSETEKINVYAFANANIKKLVIPESVTEIDIAAFNGCKVENLVIHSKNAKASMTGTDFATIWPSNNYTHCPNLKTITIMQDDTIMPHDGATNVFSKDVVIYSRVNSTAKLYAEKNGYQWCELKL